MGTINKTIARFDVTAVWTDPEAKLDIILVHGLNGSPEKTWTAKSNRVYWPTDLLPRTLQEAGVHANVLVYGYNADVAGNKDKKPSTNFIHEHAQTLVNYLTTFRKTHKTLRNPIIWVAHSLGGILLKRALEYSDSVRLAVHEDFRSVYISTYAIVFLGTPHEGSDLAKWGEMLQGMAGHIPRKFFDSEPILIRTLRKDSEILDAINNDFLNIQQRFKIHLVHENQKTDLKGTMSLIVDSKSAGPRWYGVSTYGIEADHSGMCKFDGFNAPGYRQITSAITEWVRETLDPNNDIIKIRWEVEDHDRRMRAQLELNERARPFMSNQAAASTPVVVSRNDTASTIGHIQEAPPSPLPMLSLPVSQAASQDSPKTQDTGSQTPKEPLFVHPEAFRPNSYFVGREQELKDLHHILQDRRRRLDGTSTVLIRCQTGGGKTHLARQYVFKHRYDYPGGVFWLRASSLPELEDEFFRIARTVALRDLKANTGPEDLQDHTKVADHIRKWFSGFDDWLIVLDGIMFDPGVERFIPDVVNTSMILTSTSPAVTGNHHFNNPKLLELPLLSAQDAQHLLLLETDKKPPWTPEDLRQATELVQLLEKLPLMIHITAQHLKTTREPLSTYLKRYKKKPHIHQPIAAYDFVLEQLHARGATAALNVLSVLAFLEQHVPVEMVATGLHALDKSTPYKTRDAGTHERPNLNSTLQVLIAFALVERTDSYDLSPTSSRTSKRSLDLPSESMDTLQMHSIIQRYLIEHMAKKRQLNFWLKQAVGVFLRAFQEADTRIKDNPRVGLPEDYRRFSLHGKRLVSHLAHYEKKTADGSKPLMMIIEETIRQIDAEAQRLQEEIQSKIVKQSTDIPQLSIFDRANSLSESESGTTSSQSQETWIPAEDGEADYYASPVATESQYPNEGLGAPPYPEEDDDTPTPQVTPRPGWTQPVRVNDEQVGWEMVISKSERRKQQKGESVLTNRTERLKSPAEVRISMETAQTPEGFFHNATRRSSQASSKGRLSAHSEAEQFLAQLRKSSPTPPRGGGMIQSKGRSWSSGSGTRPRDIMTRSELNKAGVASGVTPTDERSHAELSRDFGSASTTTAFDRLKEMMPFNKSRKSSSSSASRLSLKVPNSIHTSPGVEQMPTMPAFLALPTRSARSSPGQAVAPFPPPDRPARRNLPPSFQQWNTTDAPYHPGLGRIESSNLGQNPMAMSFPVLERTMRRQDLGNVFTPAAWLQTQEEAVSAPMSRGSSHPSSNPSYDGRHHSADSGRGDAVIPGIAGRPRRGSSPLSSPTSSVLPFSRPPNVAGGSSRPPSIATEPSPRISPRYDVVDPPYQSPLSMPVPRPPAGSRSSGVAVPGAAVTMPVPNMTVAPRPTPRTVRRQGLYQRAWGRIRSGRGRQSVSPSADLRAPRSRQGSPSASAVAGGEDMMRSSSGGIVVGEGSTRQIISFGEVPVNIDVASHRLQERQERRRGYQQGVHLSPMSRSSSGGVGLGIMPEGDVQ